MKLEEMLQSGYRYALALTHNEVEAEDLVQDVFLRFHEKRPFGGGMGYFLRSIRNRFIDEYRKSKRVVFEPISEELVQSLPDELQWDERYDPNKLHEALGRLRSEEREMLYLSAVEGLSATKISAITELPRGTVLSLIHRTREKMARMLNEGEGVA